MRNWYFFNKVKKSLLLPDQPEIIQCPAQPCNGLPLPGLVLTVDQLVQVGEAKVLALVEVPAGYKLGDGVPEK